MTTQVKERPILFSTPMVVGTLEDRKDITRRTKGLEIVNESPNDWMFVPVEMPNRFGFRGRFAHKFIDIACPYGKPGDILWVRETWSTQSLLSIIGQFPGSLRTEYIYKAGRMVLNQGQKPAVISQSFDTLPTNGKWKPSIHMPKAACRLRLEIVSIKVERLHDITLQDAEQEGVKFRQIELFGLDTEGRNKLACLKFGLLWQSINGRESWYANPWVWVIHFKKLKPS